MRQVELKTAYHWNCENCGTDNFSLPRKAELTNEAREEAFRHIHGLNEWDTLPEDWGSFELVCIPEVVRCSRCNTDFTTVDERVADDDS